MLLLGDCNHHLKEITDNSIDLIVSDPPYGLEFMGKDWDKVVVPTETWKECYRVLKHGKLAFVMCSPRQDVLSRMIINLQDAGFRTNYTSIYWTYASGFPKAANLKDGSYVGFQPKPAVEVILVVSKGKTLSWLDDCRIPYQSEDDKQLTKVGFTNPPLPPENGWNNNHMIRDDITNEKGRFPANLLVSDDVLNDYSRYFSLDSWWNKTFPFLIVPKASMSERNKGCKDLPINQTVGGGGMYNEEARAKFGSIKAKAHNHHPTVKPLKLMSYLITMGSREGDLVLDPFCGSGTVCIAAHQVHRKWLGIEMNPEYAEIIKKRLADPLAQLKLTSYLHG